MVSRAVSVFQAVLVFLVYMPNQSPKLKTSTIFLCTYQY